MKDIVLAFNFAFIQRVILYIPLSSVLLQLIFILNEGLMAKRSTTSVTIIVPTNLQASKIWKKNEKTKREKSIDFSYHENISQWVENNLFSVSFFLVSMGFIVFEPS